MLGKRLAQLPGTGRARGQASEAAPTASVRLVAAGRTCGGSKGRARPLGSCVRKDVAAPAHGLPVASTLSACQAGLQLPRGPGVPETRVSQEEVLGQPGVGRKSCSLEHSILSLHQGHSNGSQRYESDDDSLGSCGRVRLPEEPLPCGALASVSPASRHCGENGAKPISLANTF